MSIKLFACGDVVNFKGKEDFIDSSLKEVIRNSDISICNFEAPIYHENMEPINKVGPHVYQSFDSIKYLKKAGFDYVSLANNHIYDYEQKALDITVNELIKNKINYIGGGVDFDDAYRTKIFKKNDIKIGLLAGCENEFGCLFEEQKRGGYAWLFHHKIEDNIRELKEKCDFVVMITHAGVENIEFPIKEWRDRYKRLCDIGVDVVIGHHPHVPQGYEKHNKSMIFYSLGNFYFDTAGYENKSDDSYSIVLDFEKGEDFKFDIIYHKKINGQTYMVDKEEVSFDLNHLCNLLGKGYEKINDDISLKLFDDYYYGYYQFALGLLPQKLNIISKIKWFLNKILFQKREQNTRNMMLLHNIKIESHRFLVQRALSLMSKNK